MRTVYRDLEAIQDAGFPIYTDRTDKNVYWKMIEGFTSDIPLPVTATELMALHMGRDFLKVFEGTVFQESIASFFCKVKSSLSPEMLRYLEAVSDVMTVGFSHHKDYHAFKEIISELSNCAVAKKRVELLYRAVSTGAETKRKVDPYKVWAMNGAFYLIGYCHLRNAVQTFAMDRIGGMKALDESFNFPAGFSLDDYMHSAFRVMRGDPEIVRVRFKPHVAHVVRERIWHPSQEGRDDADGCVVVTLQVPINYEVLSWILGYGPAAKVLEPPSLAELVRKELGECLEQYDGDEPNRNPGTREKKSA